jgi:hypothetical protein
MTYNASERKDVRRAEKDARVAERHEQEVLVSIMGTIAGREWMCALLERCHVFASSFSDNAGAMAFAEGERNIGLQLLNGIMAACPAQYVLMMGERNERRQSRPGRDPEDDNGGDSASDYAYYTSGDGNGIQRDSRDED